MNKETVQRSVCAVVRISAQAMPIPVLIAVFLLDLQKQPRKILLDLQKQPLKSKFL